MLNLSGDTACDIHLRMHGNTRLTNLAVVVNPSRINGSTACAHLAVKFLSELEQLVEALFAAHAVATGNNDRSALQVMLCSFHVAVDNLHDIICCRHILSYIHINHLVLCLALIESLLHHAATNGSHLWAVFRVNDSSHDVTAESRTDLI